MLPTTTTQQLYERIDKCRDSMVDRVLPTGPVEGQSIVFWTGKAVTDRNSSAGLQVFPDSSWIAASYNEQLRKKIDDQVANFIRMNQHKYSFLLGYDENQEVGTSYYLPPEYIADKECTRMWDLWSFGGLNRRDGLPADLATLPLLREPLPPPEPHLQQGARVLRGGLTRTSTSSPARSTPYPVPSAVRSPSSRSPTSTTPRRSPPSRAAASA